jgi:hypothetical protein
MWNYLATSSFINPLPGYVENKAGDAETSSLSETKSILGRSISRAARLLIPCNTTPPNSFCHAAKNFPKEKGKTKTYEKNVPSTEQGRPQDAF